MPSPFPGMNPYLERSGVWPMFHSQFISASQQSLTKQLRPKYIVRMETRVYIHEPSAAERFAGEPDLGISRDPRVESSPAAATIAAPAPAYGTLPAWVEVEKSRYLEIRERTSERIVTVVELLSRPADPGAGRRPRFETGTEADSGRGLRRRRLLGLHLLRPARTATWY